MTITSWTTRQGQSFLVFSTKFRLDSEPSSSLIEHVPEAVSVGYRGQSMKVASRSRLSALGKNAWSCVSIPLYAFMSLSLNKQRENFPYS